MKVININHYPIDYNLWENDTPTIEWQTKKGKTCAIWDGNWSQILGDQIIMRYPEIKYEVWRPDVRADQIYSYTYPNGLVYKLFPSTEVSYFYGLKKHKVYFSDLLIDELSKYTNQKEKPIMHINAAYRQHDKLILDMFFNKLPFVGQFYTNPLLQFETNKTYNPIRLLHRCLIKESNKDFYYKNKYIIPSSQNGLEIFENLYGNKIFYRDDRANFGIDFNNWEIQVTKEEARKRLNINQNDFIFFCSSRLVPEKQIDLMIKEFGKIKGASFLVFLSGNGQKEYEHYLKKLVDANKLEDKIYFIGFVEEEKLKLYYKACDVFLSTSKSEAGPFSTALAAFFEKPVITTNTGLVYDFLLKENSALYIDKDNSDEWHLTFSEVINGSNISRISKNKVIEFFDWDRIAEYYVETYNSVLNEFNQVHND